MNNKFNLKNIKKINIIFGHYGCGKTNLAVNLSLMLAGAGKKVKIADLDIVNPYFRTADFKELFEKEGIELVSSIYAVSNLDIPAITFDISALASQDGYLIIDVGGDDSGAAALGRYKNIFEKYKDDIEIIYVFNKYRMINATETVQCLKEIETVSRMKATAIANNSNLGLQTAAEDIENSFEYAGEVSELCGLPIKYTAVPEWLKNFEFSCGKDEILYVKRLVKAVWEEDVPDIKR